MSAMKVTAYVFTATLLIASFSAAISESRRPRAVRTPRAPAPSEQLAALTSSLHGAAKYPILIGIDQEGGTVARLRAGFSESPGAMALAVTPNFPSSRARVLVNP